MILRHNFMNEPINISKLIKWLQEQQVGGAESITIRIDDLVVNEELSEYYPEIDNIEIETI